MTNRTITLPEDVTGIGKKGDRVTGILLLKEDVHGLGKQGDLVKARPGYVRNFLLPKLKRDGSDSMKKPLAVFATPGTIRGRAALQKKRAEQSAKDKAASLELAKQIESLSFEINAKVDPYGHMYGSITSLDIAKYCQERGLPIERHFVLLPKPIKQTGDHKINLRLKEDVEVSFMLRVKPEGHVIAAGAEAVVKPIEEATPEEPKAE